MISTETELVPFGARALSPCHVVPIDTTAFSYDVDRQVNVTADSRLWAETPMAASSTATNNDTSPGNPPDEGADPYAFPEIDPRIVPTSNRLALARPAAE
ncbi:putative ATP-grasp-modified RiPP [Streptomyces mobaraensis]|uniref:putative ATP-grasp-modified RiPP n=1 Tax=Streptomyces mobaraensis TaxID=35621 RepID=UPI0013DFCF76|nr:putative ATP-grasp-modified RiPP [Streptomyces mobaraensis]